MEMILQVHIPLVTDLLFVNGSGNWITFCISGNVTKLSLIAILAQWFMYVNWFQTSDSWCHKELA